MGKEEITSDARYKWLIKRASSVFAFPKTKLEKIILAFNADEGSMKGLDNFLNNTECPYLFFFPGTGEALTCQTAIPAIAQLKKKCLCTHRTRPGEEITGPTIAQRVVCFEFTKNVMEILNTFCHSIYLSTLSNPANQHGWSDLISKDLMDKYYVFLANLHVTVGLMKGKTLLPLPPTDADSVQSSKDRAHVLEGAVITWTKQIRHVLKQDPEQVIKDGLNPEPLVEIEFWKNKAANLNSIHSQLQVDGLKKVLKFLEQNKSTYTNPFSRLQKEVELSREEANDNVKFLATLHTSFVNLMNDSTDFETLHTMFDGILHTILLIWKYSKFYNTPTRLVVLMREICNTIILQACRYISGPQIFSMIQNEEASEAVDKLEMTLSICSAFKEKYFVYRDIAEQQGKGGWKIQSTALFVRLDAFGERCKDILDFTKTIVQFYKLERIDIGGTKGRQLTQMIVFIFEEFKASVDKFQSVEYDIMNVEKREFDEDFYAFRCSIKDLDRRLSSILAAGFDDLDTVQGRLKLFDAFEGLLERPILQEELERKHQNLLLFYKEDLKIVQQLYIDGKSHVDAVTTEAPLYANMPPVSGAIYWVRSLKNRVKEPMAKLITFNKISREKPEEFKEVDKLYANLVKTLDDFETLKYSEWARDAVDAARDKLKMRLLRRMEKTGLLKVNFDPALVRLLREVQYFGLFGREVPEQAMEIFERADTYRQWVGQLDIIVQKYNSVLTELLPVEEPLLEDRIVKMDSVLSPGLTDLRWRNETRIPDFIAQAMSVVGDVSGVVDAIKGNLKKISAMLSKWCAQPLLERKPKPMSCEDFDAAHKAVCGVKLMGMTEDGKEIHKLLKESNDALKVSKIAPTWKNYVDFVNNIVIEGFVSSIAVSLQYLCEILDPLIISRHDMQPLFDVKIELRDESVCFEPPFFLAGQPSLRATIDGWLKDFFSMATTMLRLDTGTGDYLNEMKEHFQMQCLLALVSELIDNTEMKCMEYRETFMQHSFLWTDDIDISFAEFLSTDAKDLVIGFDEEGVEFNDIMSMIGVDLGPPIPALAKFDEQITRFEQLKYQISNLKTPTDIHWLRINAQPVKIHLVQFAAKWENKYSEFMVSFVSGRIESLNGFIQKVMLGLTTQSPADDPENEKLLYATMTHIRDVKLAMNALKLLFQPIRNLWVLLKKHHVNVDEEKIHELEQAPARWEEVCRAALDEKEKILPLQSKEMLQIRKTIDSFAREVETFRAEVLENCPFTPQCAEDETYESAYTTLDEYYEKTLLINAKAKEYNNLELLFDMQMSNYRALKESLDDLVLLKNLWDCIILVKQTFTDWNGTLWDKINTDELMTRVKELSTQVKNLPKGMRGWKLYAWLVNEVKNMSTVLPLINDLHSDTMRGRHWTMLMTVTGKSFEKGPEFCFKDLLDLGLHHFADAVSEIVDQSAKETKIEKKLNVIKNTWVKMIVEFNCSREDCPMLSELGEIVETLEAHSLEMMQITSQGRFIEFCRSTVDEWSSKLRTVDSVLTVWQKVQLNWSRLEPIFMLSDDIRSQLPEDSKRFEQVDQQWKELMMDASQSSLIVDICCAEGREEALMTIFSTIETCEKALNDYLEQKKKAFPRFYFVANQSLLDILSNGNRPLKVATYFGDLFDGLETLNFEKDAEGGKIGSGMYAKDGEYVPFLKDVMLDGAVETYLSGLEEHLRHQLRDILEGCRGSADNWEIDRPREIWLEDYAAQLVLVTTQIVWTEETARAFEEIESGSETAMKDYKRVCDERIEKLIKRTLEDLSGELRTKIITIITIDVHGRDVIEGFVAKKLTDSQAFAWQCQLRFYWQNIAKQDRLVNVCPEELKTVVIRICDWITLYLYEYVGNIARLVITPLTDRCYITLSQALNLILGAAPAGPAGTGKTETTKDLARAISLPIVVFNCSDQMSYLTMAQIFMGLSQTGSWGCFDEFNRISIEVLSVVSTQYKAILDAIRENLKSFLFMDEDIKLVTTIGSFITMNPGYAGRTELPENLKALFRSCAMISPDLNFICENMLMSEGFVIARPLSRKFVTLYSLCKDLLSKQMHYDWGLRAVKSLLRQAGKLKRMEPDADENIVLCRALRDFNVPKITTEDMPIFLRLIQDLFPGVWPEPFVDPDFTKVSTDIVKKRGLQADPGFVLKVVGLLDILFVRHCCFLIGPSGCSKSEVWKSLLEALKSIGQDGLWEQVNPKAITSDELYGIMTKTKEWKDGAVAVIMRNMSKELAGYKSSHIWKWIILDGDIDATWIESMNTVMDDNKVLTLVSNERIPFTGTMRMLLEIQDMVHASPATVSRGGVLFINEGDVGWRPLVESWRERMDSVAQSTFYLLFSNYFESNIDAIRKQFQFSCPILDMAFVQSICCMIDSLMNYNTKESMDALKSMGAEDQKIVYEAFFIFSMMWSVGAAIADNKVTNYRKAFNGWMKSTAKIKFPDAGECFDYRFEVTTKEWVHWEGFVHKYEPLGETMFQNIIVSSVDVERNKYLLELHMHKSKPVLFVGIAGTGKTSLVKDFLNETCIKRDDMANACINNHNYTSSLALQDILMSSLDKRTGRTFGPPQNKKCIYFVDDLNMPAKDTYQTQSAIMLLTQIITYGSIYNRERLEERIDLVDILFYECMNPKAGSFMINGRLQRHNTVVTCYTPTKEIIEGIYSPVLERHLAPFVGSVQKLKDPIVTATIDALSQILSTSCFLPSAAKFHYQFNLKDVANIFQGLLATKGDFYKEPVKFLRVWLHECSRVFCDRLVSQADMDEFQVIIDKVSTKQFTGISKEEFFADPCIFTSFVSQAGGNDKLWLPAKDMPSLKKLVQDKLNEYNETFAAMNLVLFDDAIAHVCRICRIIDLPCGNALLVGVGGSGKQSLSRLASFLMQCDVINILVNQTYNINDLKIDLQEMYKKAGVKPGTPQVFLLTDGQISNDTFLVPINDFLSSGNIPALFTREEYDGLMGNIRNLAKGAGVPDDRDAMFSFLIDRVRKNLHLILCHSPVGDAFRIRGRKFPALVSCMVIDEFHPWPRDALNDVSSRFLALLLENGNVGTEELLDNIAGTMADIHLSIDHANKKYLQVERRYNYTTPKSFLELIDFYVKMLESKQTAVTFNVERLEKGLTIMEQVQERVDALQEDLKITMVQVEEKKAATAILIDQVTRESEKASVEKAMANEEATKTNALAAEAAAIKAEADIELGEAMPAMEASKEAVNCLSKPAITELKSLGKPPPECIDVCAACAFLLRNEKKKLDWKGAQKMMANPANFLDEIIGFNAEEIAENVLSLVQPIIDQPFFNYATMKGKSVAAAYLSLWVVNIVMYNKIYKKIAPLMAKVKEATATKEAAEAALEIVLARVKQVEEMVARLSKQMQEAIDDKEAVEAQAAKCMEKIGLAERLVNGLADEKTRWFNTVSDLKLQGQLVIGDCLLASAFVGYVSPFNAAFRADLWKGEWRENIATRKIPMTEGIDPLFVLASESDIAGWNNEGLPADRISIENAAVITSCARWPLMIDPQLQGVKWIKQRVGEELTTIQFTTPNWLSKVVYCLNMGTKLLIEAIGSEIDAILEPVLSRAFIKKGRSSFVVKIGGDDVDFDPRFQLFLQCKLPNPHYRPEIAAQCTIINFIVTPEGLEDQILAMIVNVEKPELEQEKQGIVRQQNEFKVTLAQLEDDLLAQLAGADPATILDNIPLIEGLEKTKATSTEINIQVKAALETEIMINKSRELYRPVAAEGSMLFFLIIQLCIVEHMYQYSLDAFVGYLYRAIDKAEPNEDMAVRSKSLISTIRIVIFRWVNRGLFERHKLIFCALLTFRLFMLNQLEEKFDFAFFDFLLRGPSRLDVENPMTDWLPNTAWFAVQKLIELEGFDLFAQNMEKDAQPRFKEWFNEIAPEEVKLPLDWKKLDNHPFQKLLVLRCLRPDRMSSALGDWIRNILPAGKEYMDCDGSSSFFEILSNSFEDSNNVTPIFFILSPGADPVKEVESMGKKTIQLQANVNYHNVAMGQGQDVVAMAKLELGHKEGHWVMLQNIHLMPSWCTELEKKLDAFALEGSHPNFRCYLSADPNNGIPIGLLERCIKLTNEPPQGLLANLRRAFAMFNKEDFEDRDGKVKAILFGLCHFHAVMLERKKFGPMGYNMMYPFSSGDLRDSASVLYNYLEGSSSVKIPWEDLRYIFGEIMYGGHIVDDWDRKMCATYLQFFLTDDILDEAEMVPFAEGKLTWMSIPSSPHEKYLEHIETMPPESPMFFGMHPNAEIGFRTTQCNSLFDTLNKLRPPDKSGGDDGGGASPMQLAEQTCNEIFEEVHEISFATEEVSRGLSDEEKGPYQFVFLQECERMNVLVGEMTRSLSELALGFKGELTMSEEMEVLAQSLFMEKIFGGWQKLGFPTTRGLASWLQNLKGRSDQLNEWIADPIQIPKVADISKFFNPCAYLTAVKQICCQQQQLELDKLQVFTEVTKRDKAQIDSAAREGTYVSGMYIEGARWDVNGNCLEESKPKEMFFKMPVINCKAGLASDKEEKNIYICPTYCTPNRRPDFVFAAQLRTKSPPAKWVLGGVAMILDIGFSL